MTTIYSNEIFQHHQTGSHPECPERLVSITSLLEKSDLFKKAKKGLIAKADLSWITEVHSGAQLQAVRDAATQAPSYLDPDTVVSAESYDVALYACGAACAAVDAALEAKDERSLCLLRPPGHHATAKRSMGFCLFNNIAVAAHYALKKHSVGKILIVDWDVHHGNGTQDIFYDNDQVMFYSIHRHPFYPGTGQAEETGTGRGLGYTLNAPVTFGTSRQEYLKTFEAGLHRAASLIKPELVLISAGFDAHRSDQIGSLGLESEDFAMMTTLVSDVAQTYASGRIASFLEGGYNLQALAESVLQHLEALTPTQSNATI